MESVSHIRQRVRIRRFPFGAPATTSCCTGGCWTSSNAPKGKRRIRTLSRDSGLFLSRQGLGGKGWKQSWNKSPTSGSEFAYGASLSAHQPQHPSVREGVRRALTRRKGSAAYELFPGIRGCSFRVRVWAGRVGNSRGTSRPRPAASSHTALPLRRTSHGILLMGEGVGRALTRRKGSAVYELFPGIRGCSCHVGGPVAGAIVAGGGVSGRLFDDLDRAFAAESGQQPVALQGQLDPVLVLDVAEAPQLEG